MNNELYMRKIQVQDDQYLKDKQQEKQYKDEIWPKILFHGLKNQCFSALLVGKQNSGKSYLVQQIVNQLGKKRCTKIFYISGIHKIEKNIDKLKDDYEVVCYDINDIYKSEKKGGKDIFEEIFTELENEQIQQDENTYSRKEKICKDRQNDPAKQTNIRASIIEFFINQSRKNMNQPLLDYDENPLLEESKNNFSDIETESKSPKTKKKTKKKCKNEKQYVQNFIIADDIPLSKKIQQSTYFQMLFKGYRHFKNLCILSTVQDYMQNMMMLRNLYTVKIFFGKINETRLKKSIYPSICVSNMDYQQFLDIYNDATSQRFEFLALDERNGNGTVVQKCFNEVYPYFN